MDAGSSTTTTTASHHTHTAHSTQNTTAHSAQRTTTWSHPSLYTTRIATLTQRSSGSTTTTTTTTTPAPRTPSCRADSYEDITCIHTRTSRLDGHLLVRPAGEAEAGGRGPLPPLAGGAELLSDLQHDDHDEHVGREEEGVEEEHVQGVGEHAEGRGEVGGERRGAPEVVEHGEVDDLIEEVEVQPALLEGGDRPNHGVARLHDEIVVR